MKTRTRYFEVQDRTQALQEPKTVEERLNNSISVLEAEAQELEEAAKQATELAAARRTELGRLLFILNGPSS